MKTFFFQELEQTTEFHLDDDERDLGNKASLQYLQKFALNERLNFAGKCLNKSKGRKFGPKRDLFASTKKAQFQAKVCEKRALPQEQP